MVLTVYFTISQLINPTYLQSLIIISI